MPSLITVTSNADSGTGSRKEAIAPIQLKYTIGFAFSHARPIVTLTSDAIFLVTV